MAIHPARLNFNPNPKRISVKLKLFSRHFDDVATHVLSALGANSMRRNGRAATWASRQLLGLLVVVRPSLVASRVGVTSLGNCHDLTSNHQLKCVVLFFCFVFGSRQSPPRRTTDRGPTFSGSQNSIPAPIWFPGLKVGFVHSRFRESRTIKGPTRTVKSKRALAG